MRCTTSVILFLCRNTEKSCECSAYFALRKHTYSNILKILAPKHEKFQIKNCDIFHISAQNIDSGYSLELP